MKTKATLIVIGAAVLLLMVTPAILALVSSSTPDPYTTPVPFGWSLQLRGKLKMNMDRVAFQKLQKKNMASLVVDENDPATADAADDTTYKGISLKKLVGLIDDKDPKTFNKARAKRGYGVEVVGVDYFTYVYTSQQIVTLGKGLFVANLANDLPLIWGTPKYKSGVASFKPTWPLKMVSSDTTMTNKMKPSGIMRISIVAAPTPSPSASPSSVAPF